jgi:hypothetical protein
MATYKTTTRTCEYCKNEFVPNSHMHKKYCSATCRFTARSGSNHPMYHGGGVWNGYRYISEKGKRRVEHRIVMEQHLGRPLLKTEIVHHKDHNRLNNAIENLELMRSHKAHREHHVTRFSSATHKQCSGCGVIKPRSEFHKGGAQRPTHDPHRSDCKICFHNRYLSERYGIKEP